MSCLPFCTVLGYFKQIPFFWSVLIMRRTLLRFISSWTLLCPWRAWVFPNCLTFRRSGQWDVVASGVIFFEVISLNFSFCLGILHLCPGLWVTSSHLMPFGLMHMNWIWHGTRMRWPSTLMRPMAMIFGCCKSTTSHPRCFTLGPTFCVLAHVDAEVTRCHTSVYAMEEHVDLDLCQQRLLRCVISTVRKLRSCALCPWIFTSLNHLGRLFVSWVRLLLLHKSYGFNLSWLHICNNTSGSSLNWVHSTFCRLTLRGLCNSVLSDGLWQGCSCLAASRCLWRAPPAWFKWAHRSRFKSWKMQRRHWLGMATMSLCIIMINDCLVGANSMVAFTICWRSTESNKLGQPVWCHRRWLVPWFWEPALALMRTLFGLGTLKFGKEWSCSWTFWALLPPNCSPLCSTHFGRITCFVFTSRMECKTTGCTAMRSPTATLWWSLNMQGTGFSWWVERAHIWLGLAMMVLIWTLFMTILLLHMQLPWSSLNVYNSPAPAALLKRWCAKGLDTPVARSHCSTWLCALESITSCLCLMNWWCITSLLLVLRWHQVWLLWAKTLRLMHWRFCWQAKGYMKIWQLHELHRFETNWAMFEFRTSWRNPILGQPSKRQHHSRGKCSD